MEIYQKVNDDEKIKMGTDLGNIIMKRKTTEPGPNAEPQLVVRNNEVCGISEELENPIPTKQAVCEIQNFNIPPRAEDSRPVAPAEVPYFNLGAFDILELLADGEDNQVMVAQETTKSQHLVSQRNQLVAKKGTPTVPAFQNCTIHRNININITINKSSVHIHGAPKTTNLSKY